MSLTVISMWSMIGSIGSPPFKPIFIPRKQRGSYLRRRSSRINRPVRLSEIRLVCRYFIANFIEVVCVKASDPASGPAKDENGDYGANQHSDDRRRERRTVVISKVPTE